MSKTEAYNLHDLIHTWCKPLTTTRHGACTILCSDGCPENGDIASVSAVLRNVKCSAVSGVETREEVGDDPCKSCGNRTKIVRGIISAIAV